MFSTTMALAAVLEAGTGVALAVGPAWVVSLLLGAKPSAAGIVLGRCFGFALLALALACWPVRPGSAAGPARRAMLAYNALIALYLAWLGAVQQMHGLLLWPAAALHASMAMLLAWPRRSAS